MWLKGVSALALVAAGSAQAEVGFAPVDVAEHVYDGGWEFYVGGGVAAFDCSGDGLPELVAAGGENPPILLRNRSAHGGVVTFEEDTPDALMMPGTTGFYPLDIDGDGWLDLVALRVGENRLLKGGPE